MLEFQGRVLRKDVINHTGLERDPRERGLSSKGLVRPLKLSGVIKVLNPSNAEATFVQSTRTQR